MGMITNNDKEIDDLNKMIDEFHEIAKDINKELDEICKEVGNLFKTCAEENMDSSIVREKIVEIYIKIRGIYGAVGEYYENFKYNYNKMREKCAKITDNCTEELKLRREEFKKIGKTLREIARDSKSRKKLLEQEYEIFGSTMDTYHTALRVAILIRSIDACMHLVMIDLAEILGKMEGLTRIAEVLLSTSDTEEIKKKLEEFHKEKEEDIRRYIF